MDRGPLRIYMYSKTYHPRRSIWGSLGTPDWQRTPRGTCPSTANHPRSPGTDPLPRGDSCYPVCGRDNTPTHWRSTQSTERTCLYLRYYTRSPWWFGCRVWDTQSRSVGCGSDRSPQRPGRTGTAAYRGIWPGSCNTGYRWSVGRQRQTGCCWIEPCSTLI